VARGDEHTRHERPQHEAHCREAPERHGPSLVAAALRDLEIPCTTPTNDVRQCAHERLFSLMSLRRHRRINECGEEGEGWQSERQRM
jgi:hypothetical protein